MSSMFLLTASMAIIQTYGLLDLENKELFKQQDYIMAWIAIGCYVTGIEHYCASSFASLFITTPIEYSSIANSICAALWSITSMVEAYLFGVLVITDYGHHHVTMSYDWSIFMVGSFVFAGLIIAIWIHIIDVLEDGPLHKGVKKKKKKKTKNIDTFGFIDEGLQETQPLLADDTNMMVQDDVMNDI